MHIYHQGRSVAVNRAMTDFGIEESFGRASARFKEHYHYEIGPSAVARTTKNIAQEAMEYVDKKLSNVDGSTLLQKDAVEKMLIELDGCEIRTVEHVP
ncbi:MAG: hypothetical protein JXB17_12105, partial [Bacteroidales bacterium]|nr:hypothetical protein [Bacteroidales bacterium]